MINWIILNNSSVENVWKRHVSGSNSVRFTCEKAYVEQIRILLPREDARRISRPHASIPRNKLNRVTGSRSLKCGAEEELRPPVPLSRDNDNLGSRSRSLNFKGTPISRTTDRFSGMNSCESWSIHLPFHPARTDTNVVTPCFARDDRMTR